MDRRAALATFLATPLLALRPTPRSPEKTPETPPEESAPQVLVIEPGDVVLLQVDRQLSREALELVHGSWDRAWGGRAHAPEMMVVGPHLKVGALMKRRDI